MVVLAVDPPTVLECLTVSHVRTDDAPNRDVRSAPRTLAFSARSTQNGKAALLSPVVYFDGTSAGKQSVHFEPRSISQLEVHITGNHGHPSHTCLYRLSLFTAPQ